jgi:hypothetical protein
MTISDYIAEFEQQLRRRRVRRRRLVLEAADHLRESAEELIAAGVPSTDAEGEAVRRFGPAADVAARFSAASAASTARHAVKLAALALAGYVACFLLFSGNASAVVRDFPQGAPSFFAIQLAGVALLVAFVRSWRWRAPLSAPPAELTFITRAAAVAVSALLAAAAGETLLALLRPAGVIVWEAAQWLTLAFAAAALLLVVASLPAARAAAQAAAVDRSPPSCPRDCRGAALLLDDLIALTARLPVSSAPRLGALHPLRHPWRVVGLVGTLAFAAVSGVQLARGSSLGDGSTVTGALLLGLLEAAAIIGCFAVFGRFLGLRDAPSPVNE